MSSLLKRCHFCHTVTATRTLFGCVASFVLRKSHSGGEPPKSYVVFLSPNLGFPLGVYFTKTTVFGPLIRYLCLLRSFAGAAEEQEREKPLDSCGATRTVSPVSCLVTSRHSLSIQYVWASPSGKAHIGMNQTPYGCQSIWTTKVV